MAVGKRGGDKGGAGASQGGGAAKAAERPDGMTQA